MVIVGRPMNSNDPQRCPFDKFLLGCCNWSTLNNITYYSCIHHRLKKWQLITMHNVEQNSKISRKLSNRICRPSNIRQDFLVIPNLWDPSCFSACWDPSCFSACWDPSYWRSNMLLKCHLEIKSHAKYTQTIRLQHENYRATINDKLESLILYGE